MEVIRCWEEEGATFAEPFKRHIKVFLSPDKNDVKEITFLYVYMYPKSSSEFHKHDHQSEIILVLSGRGAIICDKVKTNVEPDTIILIRPGEIHQIINDGEDMLKCAALYAPGLLARDIIKRMTDASKEAKQS